MGGDHRGQLSAQRLTHLIEIGSVVDQSMPGRGFFATQYDGVRPAQLATRQCHGTEIFGAQGRD